MEKSIIDGIVFSEKEGMHQLCSVKKNNATIVYGTFNDELDAYKYIKDVIRSEQTKVVNQMYSDYVSVYGEAEDNNYSNIYRKEKKSKAKKYVNSLY